MAYAQTVASATDSTVAMIEIPNELNSASRKSSLLMTESYLSHVQSVGRNPGLPIGFSGLNETEMIQTTGSRHQTRMMRTPTIMPIIDQGLRRPLIMPPLVPEPDRRRRSSPARTPAATR